MVENDTITDALAQYNMKEDDCFFIPAGRIHAIGTGCFVAEIQQTSDVTYRIYDFKRKDKDGKERTYYVYNNCKHQEAYNETGMQGVSYTTGVPAMIGAMMFLKGIWKKPGVWNVEEFDPDPFMEQLNKQGLPWHEVFDGDLEID